MNTYQVRSIRGFTLVELLVVIAIIGVLSAIVYASMADARARSRDTARVSDLKQIELALALYREAERRYPTASELTNGALGTFLPTLPTDPSTSNQYSYNVSAGEFLLYTELETQGGNQECYVKSRTRPVPTSPPSGTSGNTFFECSNF